MLSHITRKVRSGITGRTAVLGFEGAIFRGQAVRQRLFCYLREAPPLLLCVNLDILQRDAGAAKEIKGLKEEYTVCFFTKEKKRDGINTILTPVLHGDTIPVNVPDAGFLIYAIESSGGDLGNAVVIGSSADDVKMAKRANVAILACTSAISDGAGLAALEASQPDKIISALSLEEVNNAIAALKDASMY